MDGALDTVEALQPIGCSIARGAMGAIERATTRAVACGPMRALERATMRARV